MQKKRTLVLLRTLTCVYMCVHVNVSAGVHVHVKVSAGVRVHVIVSTVCRCACVSQVRNHIVRFLCV